MKSWGVVGAKRKELEMVFIFDLVDIDKGPTLFELKKWTVADLRKIITKWQRVMYEGDGWNTVYIENHDNPRSVTRYVDDSDEFRDLGAKLLCLMVTTLGRYTLRVPRPGTGHEEFPFELADRRIQGRSIRKLLEGNKQ